MIEPSDTERGEWLDATRDYVAALECERDAADALRQAAREWKAHAKALEAENARLAVLARANNDLARLYGGTITKQRTAMAQAWRALWEAMTQGRPIGPDALRAEAILADALAPGTAPRPPAPAASA